MGVPSAAVMSATCVPARLGRYTTPPLRQCVDCGQLTPHKPRCTYCASRAQTAKDAKRPERRTYAEQQRRATAVAEHIAEWGPWCPGAPDLGHKSHASDDLTADHLYPVALGGREDGPLRVLCRSANSARGATDAAPRGGGGGVP